MINHSLNIEILPIDGGVTISDLADAHMTNGVPLYVHPIIQFELWAILSQNFLFGIFRIMVNVNGCAPIGGNRYPNFVLLDFVNIGHGFATADQMNGFS
jgi:hypothetical protein